jgi:hypothetical protein
MHTFISLLALAGLSSSLPNHTHEPPEPVLSERCTHPSDYSWCSNGEMVACQEGFVTGLQKRCAVKRNDLADELAEPCFNYGARWCGVDGVYRVCYKGRLNQPGVVITTATKCVNTSPPLKREMGSACDDDGKSTFYSL